MTAFTAFSFGSTTGGFARTMPVRLDDIYNVKDFGAVGDGSHDDTNAIRNAIVYAYSQNRLGGYAEGGGIIFFPPGVYFIGSPPLALENVTYSDSGAILLMGASGHASILKGTNNAGYLAWMNESSSGGRGLSAIRNLTFQNDATVSGSGAFSIRNLTSNEFYAENCKFIGTLACTIQGDTELSTTFRNCIFSFPGFRDANGVETSNFYPANSNGPPFPSWGLGYQGGLCVGCYAEGFDVGFYCNGNSMGLFSNRAYRCNKGIKTMYPGGQAGGPGGFYCAIFTGSISGFVLTVTSMSGGVISPGDQVQDDSGNVLPGTFIASNNRPGFAGTYNLVAPSSQTVASDSMHTVNPLLFSRQKSSPFMGNTFDRCSYGLYHDRNHGPNLGQVAVANHSTGIEGVNDPAEIQSVTWGAASGGTATVMTTLNHNLPVGNTKLLIRTNPVDWTPDGSGQQVLDCTNTGANTFTYSLSAAGSPTPTGSWNYLRTSGVFTSGNSYCFFAANAFSGVTSGASFAIADAYFGGTGDDVVINVAMAMDAPAGFQLPPANAAAQWGFIQCGTVGASPPYAFMTYAMLAPRTSWGGGGSYEGREYNITDGQKSGGGTATFGDVVAGSGSGQYKVRFNGTNWIRIG
jgi:hypothetical protein